MATASATLISATACVDAIDARASVKQAESSGIIARPQKTLRRRSAEAEQRIHEEQDSLRRISS